MTFACRAFPFGSDIYRTSLDLRYEILRKPLGLAWSGADHLGEEDAYHLGCFGGKDERLIGTLVLEPLDAGSIKMRQVAIAGDAQRQGIGTALVVFAETFARESGYHTMVAHARAAAVPFYLRLGYSMEGGPFTEVTIPHFRISKRL
jgi:GNAT superfamily N-acetyltransferase